MKNKLSSFLLCVVFTLCATVVSAQSAPNLGTAVTFAILAPAGFTNAGPSAVVGDVGTTGTSCTGFTEDPCTEGPGQVVGAVHVADPTAVKAAADLVTAYNRTAGLQHGRGKFLLANSEDLGGKTLIPGLYTVHADLAIKAGETLRLIGNPTSIFIFQVGTSVAVFQGGTITLVGGVKPANIFWQVGTAFTMAASANISGTIMASTGVTMAAGATLNGRALTTGASVTLSSNEVLLPLP
jgi:Ice-binding-like